MPVTGVPVVPGPTELPSGYPHAHASEEARAIAERGMILRVQVGSGVHGTSIAGQDNRPELVAKHGFDTKYAMHALRLGLQGIELLTTGRITLPVPEPHRAYLRSVRRGERSLAEVLDAIADAEARLVTLRDSSAVPDQPDRAWVDAWLHRSHLDFWSRTGQPSP